MEYKVKSKIECKMKNKMGPLQQKMVILILNFY
jgi:hypothetical protein